MLNKTIAVALLYKNLFFVVTWIKCPNNKNSYNFDPNEDLGTSRATYVGHNWSKRSACNQRSNLGRPLLVGAKCE